MPRATGVTLLFLAIALTLATACTPGYYVRRESAWSTTASGFVAGGGTISSTTSYGPYGPVTGVSVGPGSVTVYDGYAPYGYAPGYGYPTGSAPGGYAGYGYGPSSASPYGYGPVSVPGYAPGYGTVTTCTGAVACGASGSTTITGSAVIVAP